MLPVHQDTKNRPCGVKHVGQHEALCCNGWCWDVGGGRSIGRISNGRQYTMLGHAKQAIWWWTCLGQGICCILWDLETCACTHHCTLLTHVFLFTVEFMLHNSQNSLKKANEDQACKLGEQKKKGAKLQPDAHIRGHYLPPPPPPKKVCANTQTQINKETNDISAFILFFFFLL